MSEYVSFMMAMIVGRTSGSVASAALAAMRVIDELVDGFRHGLLVAKLGGARSGIAFGFVRRDLLGTLREAQKRPLRLIGIEAAPHVDVDVQVVFDVDRRETDVAHGKG